MKARFTRNYTSKLIEGLNSGYGELRLYPCCKHSSKRVRRHRKTIHSQQRANDRRSCAVCFLEAVENFGNQDFFLTVTFSPTLSIDKRISLVKKVIRFLQRVSKRNGAVLKYIYNWGRGEIDNQLHVHMLLNNVVSFADIIKCENLYKGVHIDIQNIRYPRYSTDEDNIRHIIYYVFYKHWYSLTDEDKKLICKRYYGSRSLEKYAITEKDDDEIDRGIEESPAKLMTAIINAADTEAIDRIVRRVFKGYRLEGYIYHEGNSPIYTDPYGQSFARLKLVKIGSRLDKNYIIRRGLKIDRYTGEVIGIPK